MSILASPKINRSKYELRQEEVGKLTIYPQQIQASKEIMDLFSNRQGPPLLVAQPQGGKTNVVIHVINKFKLNMELRKTSYQIIYLINLSDNEVREQTNKRLLQSGLTDDVEIFHHSQYKKNIEGKKIKNVDFRLIIVDECHIALGKSKPGQPRPFYEAMRLMGINYGSSIDTWENQDNYVLSVSATPYSHIIKEKLSNHSFQPVTLDVTDDYCSIKKMQVDGRLKKSEPLVKDLQATSFFKNRIEEFVDICKPNTNKTNWKNLGCLIMRLSGRDNKDLIFDFIKNQYPYLTIKEFTSDNKNINQISDYIAFNVPKPLIIVISGSLRAGKTLENRDNIRMWVDSAESKGDTVCQSVGRLCGYATPSEKASGGYPKSKFPIYCDTEEIQTMIDFYDNGYERIPSGVQNKETSDKAHYEIVTYESLKELKEALALDGQELDGKGDTVFGHNSQDLADALINKLKRSGKSGPYVIHANKANPNYISSWKKLKKLHPEYIGKYCLYVPKTENIECYHGKLSDDIMFE